MGLENIDVAACRARGVEVVYTPDANTLAVGDFVFGYVLQLLRPWGFFRERAYEPKEFKRIRNTRPRAAAERADDRRSSAWAASAGASGTSRANGFGMRVIYNDLLDVATRQRSNSPRRRSTSRRSTASPTSSRCT